MIDAIHRTLELLTDEESATATEYAVMLALLIVGAIAALTVVGQKVTSALDEVQSKLNAIHVKKKR